MYASRTQNQFYRTTKEAKLMKRVFTTNWHIYRVCLDSISEPKLQHDIGEEGFTLESSRDRGFKKLLLEAVDEGLSSLGNSSKQAIYFHLEKTFKIKKQDIPNRIEEFTNAIEKIFGHGAKILEIQIMKLLYEKVGHDFEYFPEKDELLFTEYVSAIKVACLHAHTQPSSLTRLV